jgi:mono/diheme cytochrome c family protein
MRLGFISCAALATFVSTSAFVAACSSSGDPASPTFEFDAGPLVDAALPDHAVADTAAPDAADPNDGFTAAEVAAMGKLSPLPAVPADPTNAFANNALAAVLGQRLFFDRSFSGALAVGDTGTNGGLGAVGETGKVACVSCHASAATDDGRSKPNNVSLGTGYGTRNALSIVNASFRRTRTPPTFPPQGGPHKPRSTTWPQPTRRSSTASSRTSARRSRRTCGSRSVATRRSTSTSPETELR